MSGGLEILLVEDSPSDVFLVQEALRECAGVGRVHVARDGVEALEFLRRQASHQGAPQPDLILLDLNMPRKDGREFLAEVKSDPDLKVIPIVVFTSSGAEADLADAYNLHANSYVVKPIDFSVFREALTVVVQYWSKIVTPYPAGRRYRRARR